MDRLRASFLLAGAAVAAAALFIPIYARSLGISYLGIGAIDAALTLGSIISYYLCGYLSDTLGQKAVFVKGGYLVSMVAYASQVLMTRLSSFLIIQFLAGLAIGIYAYPIVSYAANTPRFKKDVSTLTAYGALGSFAGSAITALVTNINYLFILSGLLFLGAYLLASNLDDPRAAKQHVNLLPIGMLKRDPSVYLANFFRHLGANAVWAILPIYLFSLGASWFWVAVITALNPLAQFLLMSRLAELANANRVREKNVIMLGCAASAAIFAAYAIIPNFYFAIPIALVIALAWTCLNVGSTLLLVSRNKEKATATGLLGSVLGLAQVLGLFIGGALSQFFGMGSTLIFAFGCCCIAWACAKGI